LYFCPVISIFYLFVFFFPCLISAAAGWMSLTHGVALVRISNAGLKGAARGSLQMQDPKKSPSGHHPTTLSGYIFATKACIDNRKKNLLSSNISSTCPYNMVNFGPLAAEIFSLVWGTPGNFNGFRFLAALLHGTLVVGCLFVARIQATDFDLESFRLIGRRSISCATLTSLTFRDLSTRMTDRFAVDVALFCNSYLWSEGDPLLYLECVCGPLLI